MSITKKSPTELGGFLGEELTVRKMKHRVVIKNRPKMKMGPPTAAQESVQVKFLKATKYASRQNEVPEFRALYAAGITREKRSTYLVALSDYLKAPKVDEIKVIGYKGAIGDVITIEAHDDFRVERIHVAITERDGNILEEGEAIADAIDPNLWRYAATVANPRVTGSTIVATAYDRPGNEGFLEKML